MSPPDPRGLRREPWWLRLHVDPWLLLLIFVLAGVAGFVLYSASSKSMGMVYRQGAHYATGLAAMMFVAQLQPRFMERWLPPAYVISVLLLAAVLVVCTEAKGAQRWILIPGLITFQPSEIMKLVIHMSVALHLGLCEITTRFNDVHVYWLF